MVVDATSRRLIELLQLDGRTPYATLAQKVGLSEAAVRQRVLKMVEEGVMQIVAVSDPLRLGFAREGLLGINVTGDVREVARELAEIDELSYVVITAGRYDIIAEFVAKDDDHLIELMSARIRTVAGVGPTSVSVVEVDLPGDRRGRGDELHE